MGTALGIWRCCSCTNAAGRAHMTIPVTAYMTIPVHPRFDFIVCPRSFDRRRLKTLRNGWQTKRTWSTKSADSC